MIPNNYYPVKFKDFIRIKSVGNYVVTYAILDDRIHIEMAIENAVYVTQRFIVDIEEEIKAKANNFNNDKITMFLKMYLTAGTFYRYYPTDEMIKNLKMIKLYNKIRITETKAGTYDKENLKIIETDTTMKAVDGEEVILFGVKE